MTSIACATGVSASYSYGVNANKSGQSYVSTHPSQHRGYAMCDLCGQVQPDTVTVRGLTVCASVRYCLMYVIKQADSLTLARLHSRALSVALRGSEPALQVA